MRTQPNDMPWPLVQPTSCILMQSIATIVETNTKHQSFCSNSTVSPLIFRMASTFQGGMSAGRAPQAQFSPQASSQAGPPKAAPPAPIGKMPDAVQHHERHHSPHNMTDDTDRPAEGTGTLETQDTYHAAMEMSTGRVGASDQRSHGVQLSGSQPGPSSSSLQQPGSLRATHTIHSMGAPSLHGPSQALSDQHGSYSQGGPSMSFNVSVQQQQQHQQQQHQQQQMAHLAALQQIQQFGLGFPPGANPASSGMPGFNMYGGFGGPMGSMDMSMPMYHRSASGFGNGGGSMMSGPPPGMPGVTSGPAHSHQETYVTPQATSDDPDDGNAARALKKARLVWTEALHKRFEEAVGKLGDKAVPKAIMQEMNVEGLTRENVASHLQKYRLQKQVKDGAAAVEAAEAKAANAAACRSGMKGSGGSRGNLQSAAGEGGM